MLWGLHFLARACAQKAHDVLGPIAVGLGVPPFLCIGIDWSNSIINIKGDAAGMVGRALYMCVRAHEELA